MNKPDDADHTLCSHYIKRTKVKAKYITGEVIGPDIHICPSCEDDTQVLFEHGRTTQCKNCRLLCFSSGNSLWVWKK
jgi:ferredoxin-like protein FixX